MRKLVILLTILMLVGCGRQHVYHTYYGDIDTDTMEAKLIDDNSPCYIVYTTEKDSVEKAPGIWGYIYGPIIVYYNPSKNVYYKKFHSNDENGHVIVDFSPTEK